jgi:hypothetical protein
MSTSLPKDVDSGGVETQIAGGADDIERGSNATTTWDHQKTIQMHGNNLIASHLHQLGGVVYAPNTLNFVADGQRPNTSHAHRTCHSLEWDSARSRAWMRRGRRLCASTSTTLLVPDESQSSSLDDRS